MAVKRDVLQKVVEGERHVIFSEFFFTDGCGGPLYRDRLTDEEQVEQHDNRQVNIRISLNPDQFTVLHVWYSFATTTLGSLD